MTTTLAAPETTRTDNLGTVLLRTCRAEWARIWSVRSSWAFALAIGVVVLGFATILGFDARSGWGEDAPEGGSWALGQVAGTFGMFVLVAFALVAATADHGTGGIVPTLQWTPRRGVLLAARATVVVLTTTGFCLLLVLAASLLARLIAPDFGLAAEDLGVLAEVAGVYVGVTLLSVAIGLATRNTAGGLMAVIGLILVLPLMLAILGQAFDWARDLGELVPGTGALHLMFDETLGSPAPQLSTEYAWGLLGVWAVGALALGGLRLLRADADR